MSGNFWKSSHCIQWIWDPQELELNRLADVEALGGIHNYTKLMSIFANIIQTCGENLRVRQQVIATATIYFKRFYTKYRLKDCDPLIMMPTSLYLASKVEEFGVLSNTRLISTMTTAVKSKYNHVFGNIEYGYRNANLIETEFYLLELMDCSLVVYHPYRNLLQYIEDFGHKDKVLPLAWRICNDMLRTDIPLTQPPHMQALAALYMAASSCDIDSRQWFADTTVSMENIVSVVNEVLQYYALMKNVNDKSKDLADIFRNMPKAMTSRQVKK